MTRTRQLLHVAGKDLRSHRWSLASYSVVLAVSTVVAYGWPHVADQAMITISLLAIPFSMYVTALLVLGDSAFRVDAFWATRPLSAASVFGAKLIVGFVAILLPGLLAQAIALQAFSVTASELPRLLLETATGDGGLLLLALSIAVFCDDVKSFVAVGFLTLIGATLISELLAQATAPIELSRVSADLVRLLPAAVIVTGMIYIYATRDALRGRLLAILGLVAAIATPRIDVPQPTITPKPASGLVTLVSAKLETRERPYRVRVRLIMSGRDHGQIEAPRLTVVSGAGASARLDFPISEISFNDQRLPLSDSVHLLNAPSVVDTASVVLALSDLQAATLLSGKASLHLTGVLQRSRPTVVAMMPVVAGSRVRAFHAQFELDSCWLLAGTPTVSLRYATLGVRNFGSGLVAEAIDNDSVDRDTAVETVEHGNDGTFVTTAFPDIHATTSYVLLNAPRREALQLHTESVSGGQSPLPLVGGSGASGKLRLRMDDGRPGSTAFVDVSWLREARLQLIVWSPLRRGSIDMTLPVTLVSSTDPIIEYQRPAHGIQAASGAIRR